MKKILKRIGLGIGILVVLIILFFVGYGIKAKSIIKIMSPVETKQLVEKVFSIEDTFVNIFLIKDGDQYIAFDGGNDIKIISEELKKLDINPDKIVAIFLTHTDADHNAAIKLFENAKIYLSKEEEQMINGKTSRFFIFGNSIGTNEYELVDNQEIISIGNLKIQGILTSGHTAGSMCFLVDDKYLFTGDALSLKNGQIDSFPGFFNMDIEKATESIEKITTLPKAEYIFTAHFGYSDDYTSAVKNWGK